MARVNLPCSKRISISERSSLIFRQLSIIASALADIVVFPAPESPRNTMPLRPIFMAEEWNRRLFLSGAIVEYTMLRIIFKAFGPG